MIRSWLIRLLGGTAPTKRSLLTILAAQEDRLEALESRVEKHRAEFKELRGYVYAMKRRAATLQEAPGDTNGDREVSQEPPFQRPRPMPTEGLARRFRIGG